MIQSTGHLIVRLVNSPGRVIIRKTPLAIFGIAIFGIAIFGSCRKNLKAL